MEYAVSCTISTLRPVNDDQAVAMVVTKDRKFSFLTK
jgi:hypothetical protein